MSSYYIFTSARCRLSGFITCDGSGGCKFDSHQMSSTNSEWKVSCYIVTQLLLQSHKIFSTTNFEISNNNPPPPPQQ